MIEELPDYQNEIEGWGYQVSVRPKMTGEPDYEGFMRYSPESADPVLILEAQDGGMYCFYYGFDQYISERTYTENMQLLEYYRHGLENHSFTGFPAKKLQGWLVQLDVEKW